MIFHKQSQKGVTLVELMIGLTIGLIVVGAAMTIFLTNQTMLVQKQRVDRTQEELRFAINTITRLVREADSLGYPESEQELIVNIPRSQRDCLGQTGISNVNFIRFDAETEQLTCVRSEIVDTATMATENREYILLAKNIADIQFTYGVPSSTGIVQYCLITDNSCLTSGKTWPTSFNRITSVKTQISINQPGISTKPTVSFVATSHSKGSTGNLSSGS